MLLILFYRKDCDAMTSKVAKTLDDTGTQFVLNLRMDGETTYEKETFELVKVIETE